MFERLTQQLLRLPRAAVIGWASGLILLIAFADVTVVVDVTLGFLYIFPLLLLGMALNAWQVVLAAALCTLLSDRLDPFPMEAQIGRDILIFLTLSMTGLLSMGMARSHRRETAAEQQLEFLIESSPAAILTMHSDGRIALANPSAHKLLAAEKDSLNGKNIAKYVPALASIGPARKNFRTEMQTRGQKETGEAFLADVFFSTYDTPAGPRLAAFLVDASVHLRERAEENLDQLLSSSRILVAAVSHEVRNVCGAIGMMHENLVRNGSLRGNQDFEALGTLVRTLSSLASLELKQNTQSAPAQINLSDVLTDFRILLEPICEESDIQLIWGVPDKLPAVEADAHLLTQVLLNLTRNSQRALEDAEKASIEVTASLTESGVVLRFHDNGPGIKLGQPIFQPLQQGASSTGLGLYLSRAFMRSFQGDLRHEPERSGCCFAIHLKAAQV